MKLIINYDFIEAIRNVNEPFGPMKVVRNRKRQWTTFNLPIYIACNVAFQHNLPDTLVNIGICYGLILGAELIAGKATGIDIYANKSSYDLKRLALQLNDLNVSTDYNLLLQSDPYERKYKIEFNEKKLPFIAESKYVLVPSYDFKGEIKDTSILQEHVVGSRKYVLSIGTPKREFKPRLAYSNI